MIPCIEKEREVENVTVERKIYRETERDRIS